MFQVDQFIPGLEFLALYLAFQLARGENNRWITLWNRGMRDAEWIGSLIEKVGILGTTLNIGFLIYVGTTIDWKIAVGLVVLGFTAPIAFAITGPFVAAASCLTLYITKDFNFSLLVVLVGGICAIVLTFAIVRYSKDVWTSYLYLSYIIGTLYVIPLGIFIIVSTILDVGFIRI